MTSASLAALFLIVVAAATLSCDKKHEEATMAMHTLDITAYGKEPVPKFRLGIPSAFHVIKSNSGSSISVTAAYPGMVPYSSEVRERFYTKKGTWGPDRVEIYLSVYDERTDKGLVYRNRNDPARFALLNQYTRAPSSAFYREVPVPESIATRDKITKYVNARYVGPHQGTYFIHTDNDRIAIVTCIYSTTCRGFTTWQGRFEIEYQLTTNHFNQMVDVERQVVNLKSPIGDL